MTRRKGRTRAGGEEKFNTGSRGHEVRKERESANGGRLEVKEAGRDAACTKTDTELRRGHVHRKLVPATPRKLN